MKSGRKRRVCPESIAAISGILRATTTAIYPMAGDVVYLDTSGIFAMLDADDEFHEIAARAWQKMLAA